MEPSFFVYQSIYRPLFALRLVILYFIYLLLLNMTYTKKNLVQTNSGSGITQILPFFLSDLLVTTEMIGTHCMINTKQHINNHGQRSRFKWSTYTWMLCECIPLYSSSVKVASRTLMHQPYIVHM